MEAIDPSRKNPACFAGRDLKIGNEQDEVECTRDRECLAMFSSDDIESTEKRWGGIVGMAFEFRADFEDIVAPQWTSAEFVQRLNGSEANGYAAAEPVGPRNVSSDAATK